MHLQFSLQFKYYENELSSDAIIEIVKEIQCYISSDECYSEDIRKEVKNFKFMMTEKLYIDARKLFQKLDETGNGEQFYNSFYNTVVTNSQMYFPDLSDSVATLFCINLADRILNFYKRPQHVASIQPKQLTKSEFDGLHYLAGYVVHKLLKKLKNSPKYKAESNQRLISVLENMLVQELQMTQSLVSIQTRGGLSDVNADCKNIFYEVEKIFRIETSGSQHISKIDITSMTTILCKNPSIVSHFENIVGEYEECELIQGLLQLR